MRYDTPWEYFLTDDFLPDDIMQGLKAIEIQSDNSECDGTRTPVKGRHFFTPDRTDEFTHRVVDFFKSNTQRFEQEFGYDLSHSYLRVELAQDDNNFWQVPHIDTLEKRITIIVYVDSEDDSVNLGTDLYKDPENDYVRAEWKENRCLVFKTDETKWHGFTKRDFQGKRRVLLVNYVDKDNWNSLDQVWSVD